MTVEIPQDAAAQDVDLSAAPVGELTLDLDRERLESSKQLRRQRSFAFWGAAILVGSALLFAGGWAVCMGPRFFRMVADERPHVAAFLGPLVVFATFAAAVALSVIRFVFRGPQGPEDEGGGLFAMNRELRKALLEKKD